MALPYLATIDWVPDQPRATWPDQCVRAMKVNLLPNWRPWAKPPSADAPHAGIRTQKAGAAREALT